MKNVIITLANLLICTSIFAQVAPTSNSPGAGNCLEFTTDWIKITPGNLYRLQPISVQAWVKSTVGGGTIIDYENGNGRYGWILTNSHFQWKAPNGGCNACVSLITPSSDGTWHQVTVTDDGTTLRIYLDGNLDNTSPSTTPVWIAGMITYMGIMRPETINTWVYTGQLDEVRVWNRVLTQTEIRDNMCHTLTGSEPGLVGYWQMDAMGSTCGGATQVCDMTGNGNNGTLN